MTNTVERTEWAILHGLVHTRIADLLHDRNWYRSQRSPARWQDMLDDTNRELRALLRLAREARRQAEAAAAAGAVWRVGVAPFALPHPYAGAHFGGGLCAACVVDPGIIVDPIDAAKRYADWSEAEKAAAWGR